MGRTDYVVEGRRTCLLFLTATKSDGTEGRPFSARTTDGGLTWQFLAFIGPEPRGYAVMPLTVRISATDLVTTVRCRDFPRRWIDAYRSQDDGRSWSYLATPAPDIGQGNPPCLVRLADGRLCLTYGYRARPFAIHARLSSDQGRTWTDPFVLRGDGGSQDIGYPRSVVRSDGKVVTVYAFHDRADFGARHRSHDLGSGKPLRLTGLAGGTGTTAAHRLVGPEPASICVPRCPSVRPGAIPLLGG